MRDSSNKNWKISGKVTYIKKENKSFLKKTKDILTLFQIILVISGAIYGIAVVFIQYNLSNDAAKFFDIEKELFYDVNILDMLVKNIFVLISISLLLLLIIVLQKLIQSAQGVEKILDIIAFILVLILEILMFIYIYLSHKFDLKIFFIYFRISFCISLILNLLLLYFIEKDYIIKKLKEKTLKAIISLFFISIIPGTVIIYCGYFSAIKNYDEFRYSNKKNYEIAENLNHLESASPSNLKVVILHRGTQVILMDGKECLDTNGKNNNSSNETLLSNLFIKTGTYEFHEASGYKFTYKKFKEVTTSSNLAQPCPENLEEDYNLKE